MLSVPLPEDEVLGLLGSDLSLAVVNRPDLCIVAGEAAAVDRLHETLSERGVESRQLHISVAAHSHLVEPILDEFLEFARTIDFQPPVIPYISNTTGHMGEPGGGGDPRVLGAPSTADGSIRRWTADHSRRQLTRC